MGSLIAAILIAAVFLAAAIRNWRKVIGAGPTILIVGVLCLFAFWGFTYSRDQDARERARIAHDSLVGDFNTCAAKVDRSSGNRAYNLYLISVIQRELPQRPDIAAELITALDTNLPPLTLEHDCPPRP